MVWVKGNPRWEVVFPTMDRVSIGRYSVRHPVESSGASAAERARREGIWLSRMGKSVSTFAICSPNRTTLCQTDAVRQAGAADAEFGAVQRHHLASNEMQTALKAKMWPGLGILRARTSGFA